MRELLLLALCIFCISCSENDIENKLLRGIYIGEDGPIDVEYEDSSHNLTDFSSRVVPKRKEENITLEEEHRQNITDYASRISSDHEDESDEDVKDDSDISEERDLKDLIDDDFKMLHGGKKVVKDGLPAAQVPVISAAFNNKKTFLCPRIKTDLLTGTAIEVLSPEDVTIIAAMGDALATGTGLWPAIDIEFRGASFPIGGDATIDGLVTIPNILREFNPNLIGVSHGMGTKDQLPDHQLNVAVTGANTSHLPDQARELVSRLGKLRDVNYRNEWVMILITVGTEQLCQTCTGPDYEALRDAIDILEMKVPKAFVVLLGPAHVASSYDQSHNLLLASKRCPCSRFQKPEAMKSVVKMWETAFSDIESYVYGSDLKRPTFGLVSLPLLTITSRYPEGLFIKNTSLLNRRGHNYATKWLWNRLIAGNKYNLTSAILSLDSYFCPSVGCPYFRTKSNAHGCQLLSLLEAKEKQLEMENGKLVKKPRRSVKRLYAITGIVVSIAGFMVFTVGTVLYQNSKASSHGRFEVVEEPQKKLEEAQKEEQKALLSRHNTRAQSEQVLQLTPPIIRVSRNNTIRGTSNFDADSKV